MNQTFQLKMKQDYKYNLRYIEVNVEHQRVCHEFRLTKRDDVFQSLLNPLEPFIILVTARSEAKISEPKLNKEPP